MAVRTASMNSSRAIPGVGRPRQLLRKLFLLLLLQAAYALGLVLLHEKVAWFPLVLYAVFADATLALAAGFGTRWLLSTRGWLLRTLTAAVLPVTGLAVLGYFTDWRLGIDAIGLGMGYLRWTDLTHLVVGISASWAALWAWHRPARREREALAVPREAPRAAVASPGRIREAGAGSRAPVVRGPSAGARPAGGGRPRLRPAARGAARARRASRPHVSLALVEEHRCPYCLEPVLRTDPRGVKECDVCHTLHHADCWAITGTCQVPHLNS